MIWGSKFCPMAKWWKHNIPELYTVYVLIAIIDQDASLGSVLQEVEALTMFKHRNIVSLLGIGICDGQHKYILMEYMNEVRTE